MFRALPRPAPHAPLPPELDERYAELGYAGILHDRLMAQIRDFEEGLGEDEELAGMIATFGQAVLVRILDVGYHNPYFMVFYGEDLETNERVQLVQHVNQVSVLFRAVPKSPSVAKARRIGFA